jgi:two-component system, OmpR family, KDP operon response regulator KdpE
MSSLPPTILVIEDEPQIRRFLRTILPAHGYRVLEAETAHDGLLQTAMYQPDIVLLDLGLPDLDGLNVTRRLREWTTIPIIVLSARGQEADKVAALDAGADDYLTKPFGIQELLARMRVALRHVARLMQEPGDPMFTVGELQVDLAHRRVSVATHEIHLTPIEYKLLTVLVRYAGRVVTQRQLLQEVWGPHQTSAMHYVRVYMRQLRHKLEANPTRPRYLVTEPGVGYRLKTDD